MRPSDNVIHVFATPYIDGEALGKDSFWEPQSVQKKFVDGELNKAIIASNKATRDLTSNVIYKSMMNAAINKKYKLNTKKLFEKSHNKAITQRRRQDERMGRYYEYTYKTRGPLSFSFLNPNPGTTRVRDRDKERRTFVPDMHPGGPGYDHMGVLVRDPKKYNYKIEYIKGRKQEIKASNGRNVFMMKLNKKLKSYQPFTSGPDYIERSLKKEGKGRRRKDSHVYKYGGWESQNTGIYAKLHRVYSDVSIPGILNDPDVWYTYGNSFREKHAQLFAKYYSGKYGAKKNG